MLFTTEESVVDIIDDGKTYHVTIRKFNEGLRLARLSLASRLTLRGGAESSVIADLWMFDYEHAIASWDFPKELSRKAIEELDPAVAEVIHEAIVEMNPAVWEPEEAPLAS